MNRLFLPLAFLLLPATAFAGDPGATYTLMAPFQNILSGSVDLSTYLQGIVTVIIGVAGILAMIMLVYCGVRLMVSQSASGRGEAKECIWNAVYGLLLAIGAWVILYTVNPLLLSKDLNLTNVAVAPAANTAVNAPSGIYQSFEESSCAAVPGKIAQLMPPSTAYCSDWVAGRICCRYIDASTVSVGGSTPNPVLTYVPAGEVDGTPSDDPTIVDTPLVRTPVSFSSANFSVNEGAGSVTVTVTRSSGAGSGTIDYYTTAAGATTDADYRDISGTLIFADGVTTRTFSVPILNDTTAESQENISVTLMNPTGALTFGTIAGSLIRITDNDTPTAADSSPPTVSISSPVSNLATSSAVVNVTFTATDNTSIRLLEYVYTPPLDGPARTGILCNTDCPPSPIASTTQVAINLSFAGTHTIAIRACDATQCFASQVSVVTEAACLDDEFKVCKTLPTGDTTAPRCTPDAGTSGLSVAGPAYWVEPVPIEYCTPIGYTCDWEGLNCVPYYWPSCTTGSWTFSPKVHAYAFKIVNDGGGGEVFIAGGTQAEWPPRYWNEDVTCDGADVCPYNWDEGYCTQNIVPNNLIVSISHEPGNMASTQTMTFDTTNRVIGKCGTGNGVYIDRFSTLISTTAGTGVCKVEKDRMYYLNVTVIPALSGNALYTLFWDFLP